MLRPIRRLIGAITLLFLTAAVALTARFLPEFWFSFYTDFSRGAMNVIGTVSGAVPICVWELLLALGLVWLLVRLIVCISKKRVMGWLAGVAELIALLAFLFVGLWGLNHYAPTVGEQLGLEVDTYSQTQLKNAAVYYARLASQDAAAVQRSAEGEVILPTFGELSDLSAAAFDALAEENPRFSGKIRTVKPLLAGKLIAYTGTTGVFLCLTGEASVSKETFAVSLPYTMCHELSHGLAIAAEDEANYCAFLACRRSDEPLLRYSGSYNAFLFCYNALYAENQTAASALWEQCSEELRRDCGAQAQHYAQYEGVVKEASQAVNDTYLKAFSEEGVRSYGLVTDYLIAYYLAQ